MVVVVKRLERKRVNYKNPIGKSDIWGNKVISWLALVASI